MTKIAILSDIHSPYQDDKSVELACKLLQNYNPDRVYNLGDGVDFYQFSKFSMDPERVMEFQKDLDVAYIVNKTLVSSCSAEWVYIPGNHDERWIKYLRKHPEIHGMRSLQLDSILKLNQLGIRQGKEIEYELDGRISLTHSRYCSLHSAYTAKANIEKAAQKQQSIFVGHSHRQGMFFVTGPRLMVAGVEVGCLCDPAMEYTNGHPNWQQGITFISTHATTFAIELITFHGYRDEPRWTIWREEQYTVR